MATSAITLRIALLAALATAAFCQDPCDGFRPYPLSQIVGQDLVTITGVQLKYKVNAYYECCAVCVTTPGCTGFSEVTQGGSTNYCYLKGGPLETLVSARRACPPGEQCHTMVFTGEPPPPPPPASSITDLGSSTDRSTASAVFDAIGSSKISGRKLSRL